MDNHGSNFLWVGGIDSSKEVEEGCGQLRGVVVRPTGVVELKDCTTLPSQHLMEGGRERGGMERDRKRRVKR